MHIDEYQLLTTRRYVPLLLTQFTSSLNDHILRNLLLIFAFHQMTRDTMFALAIAAFLIPFLLFSKHAGVLADTSEKSSKIVIIKFIELVITVLMAFAVVTNNMWLMLATVFALGCDVAYFLPFKHSILPQLLEVDELIAGNAFMNTMLFVAAIMGIAMYLFWGIYVLAILMVVVAALGWLSSCFIQPAKALTSDKYSYYLFEQDRVIIFSIICISWFWFANYIYLAQFFAYADITLDTNYVPLELIGIFILGIAFGSLLVNLILRSEISLTYLPLALLVLIVFTADLYFSSKSLSTVMIFIDLFMIGFANGIFIVPLYATLQHRSVPIFRGRNIAASSILNVKMIILAYLILLIFDYNHLSILNSLLIVPISAFLLLIYVVAWQRS